MALKQLWGILKIFMMFLMLMGILKIFLMFLMLMVILKIFLMFLMLMVILKIFLMPMTPPAETRPSRERAARCSPGCWGLSTLYSCWRGRNTSRQ